MIMDEDTEMARLYREVYGDVKAEKEAEYNESVRIHDKYHYLFDEQNLAHKKKTDVYNV